VSVNPEGSATSSGSFGTVASLLFCSLAALCQPHSGPAAVLGDERDAGLFEGRAGLAAKRKELDRAMTAWRRFARRLAKQNLQRLPVPPL
jgi:hypothetical protein